MKDLKENMLAGEIITDKMKDRWILGRQIGSGGFGTIYTAFKDTTSIKEQAKKYKNVIKIEPHDNGPLFVEINFYIRNCKQAEIEKWMKSKSLSSIGIPKYISSGSYEYDNKKYRFLVMDRYKKDLIKIFEENNRKLPEDIVYNISTQLIDILEYIHFRNYVYSDIKGENILILEKKSYTIYLVDFGLVSKPGKELKFDPKRAHNGTLMFTSRDLHIGVPTFRGDIETLCYNIMFWLNGSLPWDKIRNKDEVHEAKKKVCKDLSIFNEVTSKLITVIENMEFDEKPDYNKIKEILQHN